MKRIRRKQFDTPTRNQVALLRALYPGESWQWYQDTHERVIQMARSLCAIDRSGQQEHRKIERTPEELVSRFYSTIAKSFQGKKHSA